MTERCPTCSAPVAVCVCDRVTVLSSRIKLLLLQHPDEPDLVIGTARLLQQVLPETRVVQGRHWKNLEDALGEPTQPARWAALWPNGLPRPLTEAEQAQPVTWMAADGRALSPGQVGGLIGVVIVDGSWGQARDLWWKNAWLKELHRGVMNSTEAGLYGRLRREPRVGCVSSLEAAADALDALGEDPELRTHLRFVMRTMVQRARDSHPKTKAPARKTDRRRRS